MITDLVCTGQRHSAFSGETDLSLVNATSQP